MAWQTFLTAFGGGLVALLGGGALLVFLQRAWLEEELAELADATTELRACRIALSEEKRKLSESPPAPTGWDAYGRQYSSPTSGHATSTSPDNYGRPVYPPASDWAGPVGVGNNPGGTGYGAPRSYTGYYD